MEAVAVICGNDINAAICGGTGHHIGAAALGIPRPSLKSPDKISASVSVICITGHKDDELALRGARIIASECNSIAAVSTGIHIDVASDAEIRRLENNFDRLIREITEKIMAPSE
jgi:hypothetical protein